jgi:hypothetical protein
MKIITLLLTLSLTLTSFAATGTIENLINEHRYFITVEWDQKDLSILKAQESIFLEKLSNLPKSEIEEYVKKNVSPELLGIMKVRLANGENPMHVLRELSREQQGANWNGVTIGLAVAGGIALSLFVAYTWFIHNQLECDGFYDCHGGE